MDEMTGEAPPPILSYQTPGQAWRPRPRLVPIFEALVHIALGVALPVVCFVMSAQNYPLVDRPWQSGELQMYAGLIPRAACAWPFYPLLLYCMVSLMIAVITPAIATRRFAVRLGVYTGIILALQFGVIECICMGENAIVAWVGLGGAVLLAGMYELARWFMRRFTRPMGMVVLVGVALALVLAMQSLGVRWRGSLALLFYILAAAPMLTLATYLTISRILWVNADRSRPKFSWLWWLWSGSYSAAWWISVASVLDEYSKLPKSAPGGCYVVTAAAGGHPWLVRSSIAHRTDGSIGVMNPQLRRLKCAEIVLKSLYPDAHARIRSIYNRLGPTIARRMRRRRWMCDIAYCSLKPVEWIVVLIVRINLRNEPHLARAVLGSSVLFCPSRT